MINKNTLTKETRTFSATLKRAAADGDKKEIVIEGHAAIFDSPSDSGGLAGFLEVVRKGAFTTAIKEDDVRALFNHDSNYILGRNKAGTLELKEDDAGLAVKITAPDTQWARDLAVSMDRGDVSQMSFSFYPRETTDKDGNVTRGEKWSFPKNEQPQRELTDLRLFDVSIVTFPWYEDTDAEVITRSAEILKRAQEKASAPEPAAESNAGEIETLEKELDLKEKINKTN